METFRLIEFLQTQNQYNCYLIAKAICPQAVAIGQSKQMIIETVEDVLLSR